MERTAAGYRLYDDGSIERLERICALKNAGLSLAEIKSLIETPSTPDRTIIENRIREVDTRISRLKAQQRTLAAMLEITPGSHDTPMLDKNAWHTIITALGMDEAKRVDEFEAGKPGSGEAAAMFAHMREEIDMYAKYGGQYGYAFFILGK